MKNERQYRRLPGRSGVVIRNSLWLGPDHLLRVRAHLFSEEYRRYYFADIQAIVLTELPNNAAFYAYTVSAFLASMAGVLVYSRHPVWGSLSALAAAFVFWLNWRRPTCACYLKTKVSTDPLPALRRLRKARKALARMKAEIENAQGAVSGEVLEAHRSEVLAPTRLAPGTEIAHYSGLAHWILFGLMIVRGALVALSMVLSMREATRSTALGLVGGAVGAGVLLFAILAVLKQHQTDIAHSIRWLVYLVLGWYAVSTPASFFAAIYVGVQLGPKGASDTNLVMQQPAMLIVLYSSLTVFFTLGSAGLVLLWRHQRTTRKPPPLALGNDGLEAG